MGTKPMMQVMEKVAPQTGRETAAGEERKWESFPQPCGWSLHWDNEGLLQADLPQDDPDDGEPRTGAQPAAGTHRPDQD